jgi:asparagine synthase (glutamine-hydrolysing)
MPGIVGIITKRPRSWAETQVSAMVEAIRHESFYQTGTWSDEAAGIYVGWTARENSFSDGTPHIDPRGDVALIFSGEEYSEACMCRSERLSHFTKLYDEDPKFPAALNGMFHGLIADSARGTATLFNDRYGMHRLYYHESPDSFYFAVEAKAILAARPGLRQPDPKGIGEFVACSCVLENRTIFKDIYALPAASAWVFRHSTIERKCTYFHPSEWEQQTALDEKSYYRELRDVFSRNLPLYFGGREPIGMTLTGGLDTRMIMAWHKPAPGSLPCYTFGGMYRDCYDVRIARRIAKLCRQSHQVIPVAEEFLARFSHYAERSVYLSEGGVDVYRASDLYVSERARDIAPAKVVGTYGSEILRQAVMFKPMKPMPGLFRPEFLANVDQARYTYAEARRTHPVTFAAFRQSPWYHHGILGLERTQLSVHSPYMDNEFVRTVFRAPQSANGSDGVRLRLISEGSPALGQIRTDRGVGGNSRAGAVLRAFREFTFKAEYAYDYGMPQSLARLDHNFSFLPLEKLFLGRHKLLHFRVWYRDKLAKYVRQMLLDPRTLSRPYLNRNALVGIVNGHLREGRNYTTEIHKILTLELLHRLFLDPK